MSANVEKILKQVEILSREERQRLALWFEEHRRELLGDEGADELSEKQHAEILRRREQAAVHPELLEPWDGTIERVRERLHEFRSKKVSSR